MRNIFGVRFLLFTSSMYATAEAKAKRLPSPQKKTRQTGASKTSDASSLQSRCEQSSKPMRAIFKADASDLQSRCEQSSEPMRKYIHLTLVRILQSRTILAKDSAAFLENRDMIFYFRPSRRQKSETALGQEPKSLSSRYGLPAPRVSG